MPSVQGRRASSSWLAITRDAERASPGKNTPPETVTWVEILLLVSAAGVTGGFLTRHTAVGRAVMWLCLFDLVFLLVLFGQEFIADLR